MKSKTRLNGGTLVCWSAALCLAWGLTACSDDEKIDIDGGAGDTSTGGGRSEGSGGAAGSAGEDPGGAAGSGGVEEPPRIPEFVSISGDGCGFISPRNQIFPICRVNAEDREIAPGNTFQLECVDSVREPILIDGTIQGGSFVLSSESFTGAGRWLAADNTTLRCSAAAGVSETQEISCNQEGEEKVAVCTFRPFEEFGAGVSCVDLPARFDSVQAGEVELSACRVAQDGCAFRAFCEQGSFHGLVGPEGVYNINFDDSLNQCRTNRREGESLLGVCRLSEPFEITFSEAPEESCAPLLAGSANEPHFFALAASCDEAAATPLVRGVLGNEPTCAYRQNGCTWEVHCVRQEDGGKWNFSGTLKPGDTKASFDVQTPGGPGESFAVPCEFGAQGGKFSGACAIPLGGGQVSTCALSEVASPAPDTARCEDISDVDFEEFTTHGCGPVSSNCRVGLQHGCSFIAACDFSSYEGMLMSGTVRKGQGPAGEARDLMKFNGVGGYQCEVQKVLDEEIGTHPVWWQKDFDGNYVLQDGELVVERVNTLTLRAEDEWYGTCRNEALPHVCRGTDGPASASPIFQGLRLFFGERACGFPDSASCPSAP